MKSEHTTLDDFYREAEKLTGKSPQKSAPSGINREIGHFNIFDISQTIKHLQKKNIMPYNRRAYYKISYIKGRNRAEYADREFEINSRALLFATPRVPYHWYPLDEHQAGTFCIFTEEFLIKAKSGVEIDKMPIFKPGAYPVFELSDEQSREAEELFKKISKELSRNYLYKYELIRNLLLELIHYGQKLQSPKPLNSEKNANTRILSLFIELLERQFPLELPGQRVELRSANDFADRLSIHVNHLRKKVWTEQPLRLSASA